MNITYHQFSEQHFDGVVALGNDIHGDNYLDDDSIKVLYEKSWQNDINASWVALDENRSVVGFRLTYAPDHWQPDKWCSPELWSLPAHEMCYFKVNTVARNAQGKGIGSALLKKSITSSRKQGAKAGLAHIWLASPGNSAYRYFSANGGKLVKKHPNKWQSLSINDGYMCPVCGSLCECTAAEMLLTFE